ncbi:GNAT family N-acetyltransferase [Streptomyces sp. NPDC002574]|uniref:GNAT family N-acetyltransferase n=1 Tax=Streptomyces sp. NPDC002574 TaxID=3364652 RepID=UPI00367839D9
MHTNDPLRTVVFAYTAVRDTLAAVATGDSRREPDDTVLAVSGAPVAALNGVVSPDLEPDPDVVEALAASASRRGLPWSIQVRGVPGPRISAVAARHGLTHISVQPLMVRRSDAGTPPQPAAGPLRVRAVRADELGLYAKIMAEGFGVPPEMFEVFAEPALAEAEGFTFYLAEVDGVPVGTGMAAVRGDLLGVYNVSVLPDHRRRGHGRAITTEIVRAGHAAGATTAYLYSNAMGVPVSTSAGFHTAEILTWFTAPA